MATIAATATAVRMRRTSNPLRAYATRAMRRSQSRDCQDSVVFSWGRKRQAPSGGALAPLQMLEQPDVAPQPNDRGRDAASGGIDRQPPDRVVHRRRRPEVGDRARLP